MSDRATLLVELHTEELPARGLRNLGELFAGGIRDALAKLGFLGPDSVARAFATPRRLAVTLTGVAAMQPEQKIERKGPAVASGLKDGAPTPALVGFAKSCGVAVEALERATDGKAEHFVFRSVRAGVPLADQLAGIVEAVVKSLPAPKLMRWGASDVQFIRPLQGLVMMHGAAVVPGTVLELRAGDTTAGHRFLGEAVVTFPNADAYEATLRDRGRVMADFAERASTIERDLRGAAGDARLADAGLIEEVAALVEWPAIFTGRFEKAFLEVPQECLMLTMKANQKYFPLLDGAGKLLDRFLLVSNMPIDDPSNIVHGNERVLRARLSDAKFFFDQDRKRRLADLVEPLGTVVFHNKLGSQLARARRIEHLAEKIASLIGAETTAAKRAGHLCKADLMSGMVGEFPELQGIMGMYYARHDGELPVVADAIEAHYRPRFAGDALPAHPVGDAVALADKLDTLVGIYGIGLGPTGDKDPFGLRRAALGVLRILVEHGHAADLRRVIEMARDGYVDAKLSPTVVEDLLGFMLDRLRSYLRDRDHAVDEIEAVVGQSPTRIDLVPPRLEAVREFRKLPESASLAAANKRIGNILKKAPPADLAETFDPNGLVEPEERALAAGVAELEPQVDAALAAGRFADALRTLAGVRDRVDAFFDKVLVNAEDPTLRRNRLALLARLSRLMNRVADISRLSA
jgi:glycyl-tRNA synthetase beta chain